MNKKIEDNFEFRDIRPEEYERAAEIEAEVFPPEEVVDADDVIAQARISPDCFMVAVDRRTGEVAGFLYGLATDERRFRDEFFTDKSLHDPDGENIMLLGLDIMTEYQGRGLGRAVMEHYISREKAKGRRRLVLTCLENLVGMYKKFGYTDLGISGSRWGGEEWHEMEIVLNR